MAVEIDHLTRTSWLSTSRSIVQSPALSSMPAQKNGCEDRPLSILWVLDQPSVAVWTNCQLCQFSHGAFQSHSRRLRGVAIARTQVIVGAQFAMRERTYASKTMQTASCRASVNCHGGKSFERRNGIK